MWDILSPGQGSGAIGGRFAPGGAGGEKICTNRGQKGCGFLRTFQYICKLVPKGPGEQIWKV